MSDEEDYNSEDDVDYVPSDGELGSEEENSGEEEDLSVLADDAGTATASGTKKTHTRKKPKKDLGSRKRKGGIRLEGEEVPAEEANGDVENAELAQKIKAEEEQKKAEKEKKRGEDLWSSFLTDVKAKSSPRVAPVSTSVRQASGSSSPATAAAQSASQTTATPSAASGPTTNGSSSSGKITITKVFDFAGEEIKVTKEVAVDSKEARVELKKQEEQKGSTASSPAAAPATSRVFPSTSTLSAGPALLGAKRPSPSGGGLGSIVSKIGKKQKMGTLEKSKMDWESFKKKEGIEEDLKIHNKGKDGYIERMSFLNRTDLRQFEIERDLRLNRSGKR